uniref:Uncharacterized protein n=1 Tax=Arundo donax TaxID=35708 RepID=A0A0A9B6U2_ARUDO
MFIARFSLHQGYQKSHSGLLLLPDPKQIMLHWKRHFFLLCSIVFKVLFTKSSNDVASVPHHTL